jgi:light-regulated signal transduction histidine kinase (bacteriophytochrome)
MIWSQAIVATVREPLLLLDCDDRVLLASASFYRNFGVSPDQTIGRRLADLGNGEWDIPGLRDRLLGVHDHGEVFEDVEVVHRVPRLGLRTMLLNARRLVSDRADDSAVVLLAIEDVTERRALQRASAQNAADLQRSNQALAEFAAIAAHDLQEPLRKVQAFGERLGTRCGSQLDEQAHDYLTRMLSATTRMRSLIDALLEYARFSRLDGGMLSVDLQGLVSDVVVDLQAQLERTGGDVSVTDLPVVHANPAHMRQLFQNLIANGLKFHGAGVAPRVRVYVGAGDGGEPAGGHHIVVEDNGIGFDDRHRERIFRIFQRLHGVHEYEGTGIGLAVCRRIVEQHGGTLVARSEPGMGARFFISLPIHPTEEI